MDIANLLNQLVLCQTGLDGLDLVSLALENLDTGFVDIFKEQDLDVLGIERLQLLGELLRMRAVGLILAVEAAAWWLAKCGGRAVEGEVWTGAEVEAVGHLTCELADAAAGNVLCGTHGVCAEVVAEVVRGRDATTQSGCLIRKTLGILDY